MHQFDSLEEEWDEKIPLKYNCCSEELWSNAVLSEEAPDAPILLSWRRMRWKIHCNFNCCNELLNKDSTSSEFMNWDNKALSSLFWKFFICFGEYLSFLMFFLVGIESDFPEHFRLLIS